MTMAFAQLYRLFTFLKQGAGRMKGEPESDVVDDLLNQMEVEMMARQGSEIQHSEFTSALRPMMLRKVLRLEWGRNTSMAKLGTMGRIGQTCAEARRAKGYTREQVAERMGVSRHQLLFFERGDQSAEDLGERFVERLAEVLEVPALAAFFIAERAKLRADEMEAASMMS